MHNHDTPYNAKEGSYTAQTLRTDTITAPPAMPAATPVQETFPVQAQEAYTTSSRRRPHNTRRATIPADDQISLIRSETYGGNMPLIPLAAEPVAIEEPEQVRPPEKVLIQTEQKKVVKVAKEKKTHSVNFAPEAGGALSAFYNTHSAHMKVQGVHAGIMANIALSDHFALQPKARYIMKGDKDERPTYNEGLEIRRSRKLLLNYVEMPVNLVYKIGEVGTARFMVGAGPYVSYLASATERVNTKVKNSEGFIVRESNTKAQVNDLNRWDAGGGAFIGCQTPKGLYATAGVQMGVMNLQKNTADTRHADNNYSVLLSVGYILGAKGNEY